MDKLEKYFEKMFFKIQDNMDCVANWKNVETLLHKIYLDGCRAQADADRVAVKKVYLSAFMKGEILVALSEAEIKGE